MYSPLEVRDTLTLVLQTRLPIDVVARLDTTVLPAHIPTQQRSIQLFAYFLPAPDEDRLWGPRDQEENLNIRMLTSIRTTQHLLAWPLLFHIYILW